MSHKVPNNVKIIVFTDDIAIVAEAHNAEFLKELINPILVTIDLCIHDDGLSLAPSKSKSVMLTKKHNFGLFISGF